MWSKFLRRHHNLLTHTLEEDSTFSLDSNRRHEQQFHSFSDRERITNAIHERAPLECGAMSRARAHVVAYPSLKDRVRFHLASEWSGADSSEKLESFIKVLGQPYEKPEYREEDSSRWVSNQKFEEAEKALRRALHKARDVDTRQYAKNGQSWIRTIIPKLVEKKFFCDPPICESSVYPNYEILSPVDINDGYRLRIRWEAFANSHNLHIFEDLSGKRDDIIHNFISGTISDTLQDRRNFTVFRYDAFTSLSESVKQTPQSNQSCDCSDTLQCKPLINSAKICRRGASRTRMAREFSELKLEGQPSGGSLICADYWVIPLEAFLHTYRNEEQLKPIWNELGIHADREVSTSHILKAASAVKNFAAHATISRDSVDHDVRSTSSGVDPEILNQESNYDESNRMAWICIRALANWMREWFQIGSEEHGRSFREDFVFSFISDGRAILISDLRPDENKSQERSYPDDQTRTVIIDLAMFNEERGRMLQRLMDIAAFRHLGLRGHPYVRSAVDALTELGVALSEINSGRNIDITDEDDGFLKRSLERVFRLSRSLDLLNLVFTYGITGKWLSTKGYAEQIAKNLELIREDRIPGYQTLNGYLDRFFSRAQEIERFHSRYDTLRIRLNEAASILRTKFGERQLIKLNNAMKWGAIIASVVGLVTIYGIFR